ncbi:MAG: VOC family protein [bacterium]|nr:VOC family protein [bacterium]
MRITLTNVIVDDQAKALAFYTEVLGFRKYHDVPVGEYSWLTVVSPEQPDGPELLLEPAAHPAARASRDALTADGVPSAQFTVDDVHAEHARLLAAGVEFAQPPTDVGTVVMAVFDDTCGNLIQIVTPAPRPA